MSLVTEPHSLPKQDRAFWAKNFLRGHGVAAKQVPPVGEEAIKVTKQAMTPEQQIEKLRKDLRVYRQANDALLEDKNSLTAQMRQMKDALFVARRLVVDAVPEKFRQLLQGYHDCTSQQELQIWYRDTALAVAEQAERIKSDEMGGLNDGRAYCPLCGLGSRWGYRRGYAWPDGLHDHLYGGGQAHNCDVMQLVRAMAVDHLESERERKAHGGR